MSERIVIEAEPREITGKQVNQLRREGWIPGVIYGRKDPEAVRVFYMSAHYRGPMEFEMEKLADGRVIFPGLDEAEDRVDYLYGVVERLATLRATRVWT